MQRSSIIGSIYGYLVCLIAILVFIHSGAGFVRSAFGIANPAIARHYRAPMMARARWGMPAWRGVHRAPAPMARGVAAPGNPAMQNMRRTARAGMIGQARLRAVAALVVNLVLLGIASALFFGHWRWLQREQPA
jgi:hypothetical protein